MLKLGRLDTASADSSEIPRRFNKRLLSKTEEKGRKFKEHLLHYTFLAKGKSDFLTFWHFK